jgi:hypothetical protein
LAYWNQEFQRIHSPILRYGFSVVSVAIALGVAFALQHYQFREAELPVLTQLRLEILDHGLPPQREFGPEERPDTSA